MPVLEALMTCVQMRWMAILVSLGIVLAVKVLEIAHETQWCSQDTEVARAWELHTANGSA